MVHGRALKTGWAAVMIQDILSKGKVEPWQEYPTHSGEVEEGSFVAWPTAYIQPRREALQTARPKQNLSETQGLKDALHPDKFVSPGTIMSRDRQLRSRKWKHYDSTIAPFYHIWTWERANHEPVMPRFDCFRKANTDGKRRATKWLDKREKNWLVYVLYAWLLSDDLSTGTHFFNSTEGNLRGHLILFVCVIFVIRAHFIRSIRFSGDGGCISNTRCQNARKWRNNEIINPLLDGLTCNTSGHLARFATQLAKYPRVLYVKPSNKVYVTVHCKVKQPHRGRQRKCNVGG